MTSGMTSGAVIMPPNSVLPRNRPKRASARPATVPSTTEAVADIAATLSDSQAAPRSWSFCSSSAYHLVEKPPHTVTSRDSLKE
ncbi:hypothetical protein D3C72_2083850 [compost metagenome]